MKPHACYRLPCLITPLLLVLFGGCGAVDLASTAPPGGADPVSNEPVGIDKACFDIWSLVRFASGYGLSAVLGTDHFAPTYVSLVAYEYWEVENWPYFSENQLNQRCDVFIGSAGWLAWQLRQ